MIEVIIFQAIYSVICLLLLLTTCIFSGEFHIKLFCTICALVLICLKNSVVVSTSKVNTVKESIDVKDRLPTFIVKTVPLIDFSGPLKGKKRNSCMKLLEQAAVSGRIGTLQYMTEEMNNDSSIPVDLKVLAYIYLSTSYTIVGNTDGFDHQKVALDNAHKLANRTDCENSTLLHGMAFMYTAQYLRHAGQYKEAVSNLREAKASYFDVVPCPEKGVIQFQEAANIAASYKCEIPTEIMQHIENLLVKAVDIVQVSEDYNEQHFLCLLYTSIAALQFELFYSYHETVLVSDRKPSADQLRRANAALSAVPKEYIEENTVSPYIALYYFIMSEYYRHNYKYKKALECLQYAESHVLLGNYTYLLKLIRIRQACVTLQ